MAQPLTAIYRLKLELTVTALVHTLTYFVQASASILATSGYYLWDRNGIASIDAGDGAQSWWAALKTQYSSAVSAPNWLLEKFDAGIWFPVAGGSLTGVGTNGTAVHLATQITLTLRTEDFQRARIIILESSNWGIRPKSTTLAQCKSELGTAFMENISGEDADAAGIFNWMRSRNTKLLHPTSVVVGLSFDSNDKLRRGRGY